MTETTLSQTILPVRFVYLNKEGNVVRIYNNVTNSSTSYILKFYDYTDNTEQKTSQRLINQYILLAEKLKFDKEGYIEIENSKTTYNLYNQPHIKIIATPYSLEEIHTYL